jgi:5-methylcytosine-specific restriction endonuclease McrA
MTMMEKLDSLIKAKHSAKMAKRRATKLLATPKWLTDENKAEMQAIYVKCTQLTKETGISHHVDHIIPLKGKTVTGLHVPWNLQILTATENISKGNRF